MLELRMFLVDTLKNFDVELSRPEAPPKITMYWMLDHIGLNAIFNERTPEKKQN